MFEYVFSPDIEYCFGEGKKGMVDFAIGAVRLVILGIASPVCHRRVDSGVLVCYDLLLDVSFFLGSVYWGGSGRGQTGP